jgi:hypothetical protein
MIQQGRKHKMGADTTPQFSAFGLAAARLLEQYHG